MDSARKAAIKTNVKLLLVMNWLRNVLNRCHRIRFDAGQSHISSVQIS